MRPNNDHVELRRRLDRLEQQNHWLKLLAVSAILIVTSAGLVGFSALQDQTVWARQFILIDEDGNKRAELASDDHGAPLLQFFDEKGRARTQIGTFDGGSGLIRLRGSNGAIRLQIAATSDGPATRLYGSDGTRIAELGTSDDGDPVLLLNDEEGNHRAIVTGGDDPTIQLLDSSGNVAWERDSSR